VTSDFRSEVEIWPFCACAMKYLQYNGYLWTNRRYSDIYQEIGVKEVDGKVTLILSEHNYMNISVIVDSYMGQIDTTFHRTYF